MKVIVGCCLAKKPLIFKVDPVATGSDTLVVDTEEMPPGNKIPTHKHLYEDEVIFVHKGAVRVTLAGREYDARTGATVFVPHGNWIGVEDASSEPATILFFFNKPAFDQMSGSRWLQFLETSPSATQTLLIVARIRSPSTAGDCCRILSHGNSLQMLTLGLWLAHKHLFSGRLGPQSSDS
jgi:quercetin dioxygenase-like cupin family protein